jgi:hypothetical protein
VSGAAVTPQEAERFMEGRGIGKGATEAQFRSGITALASELRSIMQAKQAKYRPEVVDTLRQRGGFTADKMGRGTAGGLGRAPRTEADLSQMSDEELRAFVGGP